MDKSYISDVEAVCRQYRSYCAKKGNDNSGNEPESSLPFIIDLLAQTFTKEGKISQTMESSRVYD